MNKKEVQQLLQERIFQLADSNNLSMHRLSILIGKSPDYIQKVISGNIMPPLYVIIDICDLFNITISELLDPQITYPEKQHRLINITKCLPEHKLDALLLLLDKK